MRGGPAKTVHIPIRTCIGCREKRGAAEMLRIGVGSDDRLTVLNGNPKRGRSAYVCATAKCVEHALQKTILAHVLRMAVTEAAKEALKEDLRCKLR